MNRRKLLLSAPLVFLFPRLAKAQTKELPFDLTALFEWGHDALNRNGMQLMWVEESDDESGRVWTLKRFNHWFFSVQQRVLRLDFLGVEGTLVADPIIDHMVGARTFTGKFIVRVSKNEEFAKTFKIHNGVTRRPERYVRFDTLYGEPHETVELPRLTWDA